MAPAWDLPALLNAADPKAPQAARHMWLVRLMEWLRHSSTASTTPTPILRLRQLLNVLDGNPQHAARVQGMLHRFWREIDAPALFADFGFAPRVALGGELVNRIRQRLLPRTPETADLAELFPLLFDPADTLWLEAIDEPLRLRLAALLAPPPDAPGWRQNLLDAVTILVSAVHAAGYAAPLRKRMDPALRAEAPFRQLTRAAEALHDAVQRGDTARADADAAALRTLLERCRRAGSSINGHLEEFGISIDIVFATDQLRLRTQRIEQLVDCVLAADPGPSLLRLLVTLVELEAQMLGLRPLLARHTSLLARQVAERNAETGAHYITRDRSEYRRMLRRAAGGGAVIAGTTFVKFGLVALGLSLFWNGFWAGTNYAASFVLIMLLHWTVATKQPAMTAPALAATLGELAQARSGAERDAAIEAFVDRVAALIRSQAAGIFGNLAMCAPLVLGVQLACGALFGQTPVNAEQARYVLHSLTLLGPTAFYAAFTGGLLFASSLIAGWVENWFVFQRLDSAITWNPHIVARLGAGRALRWATWWRNNISGLAANVSLGMMLGLVPALFVFFGVPIDVRHVTLGTGMLSAAGGALGAAVLVEPAFWWCVAGIAATGALNLTVSFGLAFWVALRSRGILLQDRRRIAQAIRSRLRRAPLSFLWPPRE